MKVEFEPKPVAFVGQNAADFSNGTLLRTRGGTFFLKLDDGVLNLDSLKHYQSRNFGLEFEPVPYEKLILRK